MNFTVKSRSNRAPPRIVLVIFFGVFFAMGCFFFVMMTKTLMQELGTRSWAATPCQLQAARVKIVDADSPYQLVIQYTYDYSGHPFTGTRYTWQSDLSFSDFQSADRLVQAWQTNPPTTCYVDSANPAQAVLHRTSLFIVLELLFPLVFVAIGVGGMYAGLRMRATGRPGNQPPKLFQRYPRAFGLVFSLIFLGAGLAVSFGLVIPTLRQYFSCAHWIATPCQIAQSRVRVSHGNHGSTTQRPDIIFSYTVDGHAYYSNQYRFMPISTNTGADMGLLGTYPKGSQQTCYVNPANPYEAVLIRDLGWSGLFLLFPLPFLAVGIYGIIWCLFRKTPMPA